MKAILLIISMFLLTVVSTAVGETGVEVTPTNGALFETGPRTPITVSFQVANKTSGKLHLDVETEIPEGWALLARDRSIELGAGESTISLVIFLVSQTAPPGRYEVRFGVKAKDDPSVSDVATASVDVLTLSKLEVKLLEASQYVVAGRDYTAVFAVTNHGNAPTLVRVRAESGQHLPFSLSAERLHLSPGEQRTVKVTLKTDPKARTVLRDLLIVTARALGDITTEANANDFIEIIPRVTGDQGRFHSLPMGVTLSYMDERHAGTKSQFQATFFGAGTLDEAGEKHVGFRFRGPDVEMPKIMGERDEYHFTHWTDDYEIAIGDRHYSVSPLIENYRYGRGFLGKVNLKRVRIGGHSMETRWDHPQQEQTAAYVDYMINGDTNIGVNYLRKKEDGEERNIIGIEGDIEPLKNTDIEFEYSRGLDGADDTDAYRARLHASHTGLSYTLRFIRAGAKYPGYYHDMDLLSTSVSLDIWRNLKVGAGFQQDRHNLNLDPALHSAPLARNCQLRLGYRIGAGIDLSLTYRRRDENDRLTVPRFDFREDLIRSSIGLRSRRWNVYVSSESGRTKDRLGNDRSSVERYTASLRLRPSSAHSYGGYLHYDDRGDPRGVDRRQLIAGLSATFRVRSSTLLDLSARSESYEETGENDRQVYQVAFLQELFKKTTIHFRGYYTSYRSRAGEDHLSLMVAYTVPIGFPVSRKESAGQVKGRVYDQKTRTPLPNIILRLNGYTAVTDGKGSFVFPSVSVGTYHLKLDRASIGFDKITVQKSPLEISVEGGRSRFIEFGIVGRATLYGQVMRYRFERPEIIVPPEEYERRLVEDSGLSNTVVELSDGVETRRLVTDSKGRFAFDSVRPGRWVLRVYDDNLPEHSYLEETIFEFESQPGDTKQVLVKVLPRKRAVRIIEEKDISAENIMGKR